MVDFNLRSDNEAPVCSEVMEAILAANGSYADAYGGDTCTAQLDKRFSEVFESRVSVLPLVSGTAANSIALAQICPPYGAVFCHEDAHIAVDECGAPEFYGGGLKLMTLGGANGLLSPETLDNAMGAFGFKGDHEPLAAAVSITQATEWGTLYPAEQIAELGSVADKYHMALHMDGARFGNAVSASNASPAALTWQAGVDVMSFGATKNGAMAAEAIIFFADRLPDGLSRRRMKGGHLLSKMRYVSAQLIAMLDNDLWLRNAAHSNKIAARLAAILQASDQVRLHCPVEANELFVHLPDHLNADLVAAGFRYHAWPGEPGLYRMVVPFDADPAMVDAMAAAIDANGV